MTVSYSAKVATTSLACFLKLLLRWKGSIYKLLWKEVTMFIGVYYILSFIYRFGMTEKQKRIFEMVSRYCEVYNNLIPVAFVLGFYVTLVVSRWWEQFNLIPWPDRMGLFVTANVHGHDERGRLMRRTIMRYLCLAHVITLSSISTAVKKRFPTFQHMTEAGFMNPNEEKIMEEMKTSHNKYFVPLVWTTSLVTRARKEGRIRDDFAVKTLVDEINSYRGMLGSLFNYDWVSVPLVYTQVTTIAVYMFVLSCLMGRQFTHQPHTLDTDLYVPVFTFLQISFYVGWLKVAEVLVNPFGEDDDDFEMNFLIDRNLQVSYLIVDEMHQEHPELIKDQYWDETDFEVPYTAAAEQFRISNPPLGSAMDISLEPKDVEFVPILTPVQEDLGNNRITSPADIPIRIRPQLAKSTSSSSQKPNTVWSFLKRSVSRDSKMTNPDSPRVVPSRRYRRYESITTQTATPRGSPTNDSRRSQDEMFNMDDLSDYWAGGTGGGLGTGGVGEPGGSPYSERRGSMENRPHLRKKRKDRVNIGAPPQSGTSTSDERALLSDEAVSKQSLWSSRSSLPSIDEENGDKRDHVRHVSNGSTVSTASDDPQYDTVKYVLPGMRRGAAAGVGAGQSSAKVVRARAGAGGVSHTPTGEGLQPPGVGEGSVTPEVQAEAQALTPHNIIVFDRSAGGSVTKLVPPTPSPTSPSAEDPKGKITGKPPVQPKPSAPTSSSVARKLLPRQTSSPVDKDIAVEMDVRRTVSLHDSLQK